jgi:nucleotide-binding universal stress UspA family protein
VRVVSGKPYVQILQAAAGEKSDLIGISVRGRNPLDMTLFGSTANQIVRRATCPVLTLRQ